MSIADELFRIADSMEEKAVILKTEQFSKSLEDLINSAEKIGKAWSGSWLGHHSRVYYSNFADPPPGNHFNQEWGLMDTLAGRYTVGDWREYRFDDVIDSITQAAGNPDTRQQKEISKETSKAFEESQSGTLSLLSSALEAHSNDKFLNDLLSKVERIKVFGANNIIDVMRPKGQMMSRDSVAIQAGLQTPPHFSVLAEVHAIQSPFIACEELAKINRKAASHLQNIEKYKSKSERIGINVFIGHGKSQIWKELKDFIQDRMRLPWDEFNRVPVAGVTNIARLSQMLDEASIAFLIMTAEDEKADGKQHARQNVIHEAGLFQGRLGFERAIILLEDGCEEFSNVQGLGQIRFPKGNVSAIFEDIRRVLEREKLVDEK